jgi:hypothetical protein
MGLLWMELSLDKLLVWLLGRLVAFPNNPWDQMLTFVTGTFPPPLA